MNSFFNFLDLKNLTTDSFEPPLLNQQAVVPNGQELQVNCILPEGLPIPKLYWKDPNNHIISDSGPTRVQDGTLIISNAKSPNNEGNYTCIAENIAGETEMSVQVIVSCEYLINIFMNIVYSKN